MLDKVGTFGMLRYCWQLFPDASKYFTPLVITLAVIGILYGAIVAIGQRDMKRLIAYTSISHFGFIALGIFAMTSQGVSGATLYMVNHGFVHRRAVHPRRVPDRQARARTGSRTTAACRASPRCSPGCSWSPAWPALSLPGLSTFVSEFLVLVGTFTRYKLAAIIATSAIILAAIYILWMYQRTMTGPVRDEVAGMKDLRLRELLGGRAAGRAAHRGSGSTPSRCSTSSTRRSA